MLEPVKVHDIVEGAQAQEARANVGMQVAVRPERRLAVVEVQGFQVLQAHDAVEFGHGGGEGVGRAQVVAASKRVARVEAHADAGLVVDAGDDGAQVVKGAADDVAVAAHVLDDGDDVLGGLVGAVQLRGDARCRVGEGGAARRPGVEVVQLDAEGVAALQVVEEVGVGLVGLGGVGLR